MAFPAVHTIAKKDFLYIFYFMAEIEKIIAEPLSHRECPPGMTADEWQIALRKQAAQNGDFEVSHSDDNRIWGDYSVQSGMAVYRVAFRGVLSPRNFCSCLDFKTNGLGTCKHIEAVTQYLEREVPGYPWANLPYTPAYSALYVNYKDGKTVMLSVGTYKNHEFEQWSKKYFSPDFVLAPEHYPELEAIVAEAKEISPDFRCYEDVLQTVKEVLDKKEWRATADKYMPAGYYVPPKSMGIFTFAATDLMYRALHKGYGLFVDSRNADRMRNVMLALSSFILKNSQDRILIVVPGTSAMEVWKQQINRHLREQAERFLVCTAMEIEEHSRPVGGTFAMAYVEDAQPLTNWTNALSKLLKRLDIKHVYLHVGSLERFTPVQVNSVVQHISQFLLGPLHRFIDQNTSLFPLKNNPEALPDTLAHFVFFLPDDILLVRPNASAAKPILSNAYPSAANAAGKNLTANAPAPRAAAEGYANTNGDEVTEWIRSLNKILSDPQKTEQLRKMLAKLL